MSTKPTKFSILQRPRVTEKAALLGSQRDTVVFDVHPKANKKEIRAAVEKIFEVKVIDVRTVNCIGKGKGKGVRNGGRDDWKKAYITLEKGSSLDIIEGL